MSTYEPAAGWKWPQPVGLTEINPNSNDLDFSVWGSGPTEVSDRRHVMPIITPVYPAQNATANVSLPPSFFFFFTLVTGPRRSLSLKLSDA